MTERALRALGPKPAVKKAKKPDVQAEPPVAWQLSARSDQEGPAWMPAA